MKTVTHHHPAAPCRLPLTEVALCAWVGSASPGDRLVYHTGFLSFDTAVDSRFGTPAQRQELRRVAGRAWRLAQEGIVHLVQRRLGEAAFDYMIVVRPRPRVSGGALEAVLEQAGFSDMRRTA